MPTERNMKRIKKKNKDHRSSTVANHSYSRQISSREIFSSITATVAEGVTLNVGGRWYQQNVADEGDAYQVAASVSAAVTESITLTGEVGYVAEDYWDDSLFYGSAKLAWAPGGGYTSSIKGTVSSGTDDTDIGYKIETEFKKTFE